MTIDADAAIDMLKEPLRFEFVRKECDFEKCIVDDIAEIVKNLGLPDIQVVERQKTVTLSDIQIRMDIIVRHVDDTITIFEVKKVNSKNPQSSPYWQMGAIGQLLLYKSVVKAFTGCEVRLVLVDNKIFYRTRCAFLEEKLPITLVEIQKDRMFVPYVGW